DGGGAAHLQRDRRRERSGRDRREQARNGDGHDRRAPHGAPRMERAPMMAATVPDAKGPTTTCAACGGTTRVDVARPASTYAAAGTYAIATCEGCGSGRT